MMHRRLVGCACAGMLALALGGMAWGEADLDKSARHYPSFSAAKKDLFRPFNGTDFLSVAFARGTTTFFHPWHGASNNGEPVRESNRTYDDQGEFKGTRTQSPPVSKLDHCPWGWHSGVTSHCGHLLCYPVEGSDFQVELTFTYDEAGKVVTGKYVRVEAVISAPNDCHMPTEAECLRAIKYLAETGYRGFCSLRAAAKMRYGCVDAYPYYGRNDCQIGLLCKKCRPEQAWDCVKPTWKIGQKRTR